MAAKINLEKNKSFPEVPMTTEEMQKNFGFEIPAAGKQLTPEEILGHPGEEKEPADVTGVIESALEARPQVGVTAERDLENGGIKLKVQIDGDKTDKLSHDFLKTVEEQPESLDHRTVNPEERAEQKFSPEEMEDIATYESDAHKMIEYIRSDEFKNKLRELDYDEADIPHATEMQIRRYWKSLASDMKEEEIIPSDKVEAAIEYLKEKII